MEEYLQIGKIVNTHGYMGNVKMQVWCDSPKSALKIKKVIINKTEYNVEKISIQKDVIILKLHGVDTFDTANALREKTVFASRNEIVKEEGKYFIADIIGLEIRDFNDKQKVYGILADVLQYGDRDIYSVKTENGEVLVPAVDEFIKKTVLGEAVYISPIGGMFDEV